MKYLKNKLKNTFVLNHCCTNYYTFSAGNYIFKGIHKSIYFWFYLTFNLIIINIGINDYGIMRQFIVQSKFKRLQKLLV